MIEMKFSSLKDATPVEYVVRFLFGGACTVGAGLIAKRFGPAIGGLFLAFPAIFLAGASLIASHERKRKGKSGFDGTFRGRAAASIDSAGAAVGSIGLVVFAFLLWMALPVHNVYGVISVATFAWVLFSTSLWAIRRRRMFHRRKLRR